jgi:hypothetical protein
MLQQRLYETVQQDRERERLRRVRAEHARRALVARRRQRKAEQAHRALATLVLR